MASIIFPHIMGTQNSLPPDLPSATPTGDQTELLKFLAEESRKNRQAMREEAEAVREFFIGTSKIMAIPLAVAIAVAGFLFYHNLNEMKDEMVREGKAEAKIETEKMQKEIDDTLHEQFQSDKIRGTIKTAAEDAAQKEARPLIEKGVSSQVQKAVANQSGMIQRIATEAVGKQVQQTIAPLAIKIEQSNHMSNLIERVNADDATAFDELISFRGTVASDQQATIQRLVGDRHTNLELYDGNGYECLSPDSPKIRNALNSSDLSIKQKMVANCADLLKFGYLYGWYLGRKISPFRLSDQILPMIIDIALKDPSLVVRYQAISGVNTAFRYVSDFPKGGLDALDVRELKNWWEQNGKYHSELLLLSVVSSPDDRIRDVIDVYDELQRVRLATPKFEQVFGTKLEQMRSAALQLNSLPLPTLIQKLNQESCADIEKDLESSMARWENHGLNEENELNMSLSLGSDEVVWKLSYLKTCDANPSLIPRIGAYTQRTQSLSRRYGAVTIINKWTNSTLDPFDTRAIGEWWNKNKSAYSK